MTTDTDGSGGSLVGFLDSMGTGSFAALAVLGGIAVLAGIPVDVGIIVGALVIGALVATMNQAKGDELTDFDGVSLVTDPDQDNNANNNDDSNNNGEDSNNGDDGQNGDDDGGDGDSSGIGSDEPVALDLNGDGIELIRRDRSAVTFDLDHDGYRERTAWVGRHDGMLVIDLAANGSAGPDGKIDQDREIVFTRWSSTATSDMAALREVFDTNHNGMLDVGDARFSEFRIWIDANQNGRTDPGELKTLAELGIQSIDLQPHGSAIDIGDAGRGSTASRRSRAPTERRASRPT